ncbi:uncharacterized protein LOC6533890 [Drosophila yakuba]|uniref:MD-2-related lipid-recognition domain-containing protein n=1 Tax=Drosophila yakuba TaxID=7245 RepID=B4PGR3_DROYA|nr:uncharacterized protein LOC6533890 [Drosophila yakuba]EDW94302.1 uncharacterized protein Dyak_GE21904 [Drosophila yakuba]
MLPKLVTSLLCVAVVMLITDFNDAIVFKFTNVECLSRNQSWFVFHYCRLKAISREKVFLNVNGTVLHSVNNIKVHVKLLKKANGFKPWLLDVKIDACRSLENNFHPFVRIIFDLFKDFSNINHTCPFVGLQVVKDFYLRPELLKLPFPSGEYMLTLLWFFDKKIQFDTNVTFIYKEDLINS